MSRILSVNVSKPELLIYKGRRVQSSIRKQPTKSAVAIGTDGLDGDRQADLRNHGGHAKAVYIYPSEHYETWNKHLGRNLPYGTLGENLTVEGLLESELCVGDRLSIADLVLEVTQPRIPCYKLDMSVAQDGFSKIFAHSCKLGSYARVVKGGTVIHGATIVLTHRAPERISIYEIAQLYFNDKQNYDALAEVIKIKALPYPIRHVFESRLSDAKQQARLV